MMTASACVEVVRGPEPLAAGSGCFRRVAMKASTCSEARCRLKRLAADVGVLGA